MFYSDYGSFMHKLLELRYKLGIPYDELRQEFLAGFSKNILGDRPSDKIVTDYILQGIKYFDDAKDLDLHVLSAEEHVEFDIYGKKFTGYIDIVGENEGLVIVDHKSRALKQRSNRKKPTAKDKELDEMLMQLYMYAIAVKDKYGEYPKELWFNCFRNGEVIKELFDEKRVEEVKSWAVDLISRIRKDEEFRPNMDYFACKYICDHQNNCMYYQANYMR